jgi:hypothetical protein
VTAIQDWLKLASLPAWNSVTNDDDDEQQEEANGQQNLQKPSSSSALASDTAPTGMHHRPRVSAAAMTKVLLLMLAH